MLLEFKCSESEEEQRRRCPRGVAMVYWREHWLGDRDIRLLNLGWAKSIFHCFQCLEKIKTKFAHDRMTWLRHIRYEMECSPSLQSLRECEFNLKWKINLSFNYNVLYKE